MNYLVEWHPSAENDLAALWVDASDRNAVVSAAAQIDQILIS